MSLEETQARIKARIWQAVAQGDVDLSGLDKTQVASLIDLVTEAALLEVDTEMGRSLPQTATKEAEPAESIWDDNKEDVLWEGRPFLSLTLHYLITDERVRITEGLLGKSRENIELVRIQDVDYSQTVTERLFNLGDLLIKSHDPSHPQTVLNNVQDPAAVYEILRRAILNARRKHGFTYREEM